MKLTAKEMEVIMHALYFLPKLMEEPREVEMNALYTTLYEAGFRFEDNDKSATLETE